MSISFTCDFCSRKYRVDDGLAGRKVKCKECGTDLTVPASPVASAKPPARDLYGLDDDEAAAPLPPPRRPGYGAEPAASGKPKRGGKRSSAASGDPGAMHGLANGLLFFGALSFVLPFVGLQIKGLHLMPPQMQLGCGVFMIVVGGFLRIVAGTGFLKALGFTAVGGVVGLGLLVGLGRTFFARPAGPGNPGFVQNGRQRNFAPNPAAPDFGPPVMNPVPGPGSNPAPGIHVHLSDGRVTPAVSPIGTPMPGLAFHADYRMDGPRPPGVLRYVILIKGPSKDTTIPFAHLAGSGSIDRSAMRLTQTDGPFELCIEAETFGPGGSGRYRVSESIPLAWNDAPPRPDPTSQPGVPADPGMTPPPPNMPGPPPGFPGPRMPRFPSRRGMQRVGPGSPP